MTFNQANKLYKIFFAQTHIDKEELCELVLNLIEAFETVENEDVQETLNLRKIRITSIAKIISIKLALRILSTRQSENTYIFS